jgi:AraC-like DNA-binding protein
MFYNDLIPHIDYFVRRKTTPSWKMDKNTLNGIDLALITDGRAWYTIGQETYEVGRGDLSCIPRGAPRAADTCPEDLMQCFDVNFRLTGLDGAERTLPFPPVSRLELFPDILELYQKLNEEWLQKRAGGALKARALLMLILHRYLEILVYKHVQIDDPRVRSVMRHISEHFTEEISLEELARHARMNKAYLGVLFKEIVGVSMRQYIIGTRLSHAEDLLKNGCGVKEAASACGFADASYFSRIFHREKGYPPSHCAAGETPPVPPKIEAAGGV